MRISATCLSRRKPRRRAEQYQEAVGDSPKYGRIYENVATIFLKQGRNTEALTELKKAILVNPNSSTAFNSIGSIALMGNRYGDAAIQLKRAVELDPEHRCAYQLRLCLGGAGPLGRSHRAVSADHASSAEACSGAHESRSSAGRPWGCQSSNRRIETNSSDRAYAPARETLERIESRKRGSFDR